MAKFFEALQKTKGEIADLLPVVLEDEVDPNPPTPQAQADAAALSAILGEPVAASAPLSALAPAPCEEPAAPTGVRTVRIRLSATAPLLPFDNTNTAAADQYRLI